ncbi:hypothetical protein ES703_39087 [subsurface metagenome]
MIGGNQAGQAIEVLAAVPGAARRHQRPDDATICYNALEGAKVRLPYVGGKILQLQVVAQVGLIGAVALQGLPIGEPGELFRQLDTV